MYLLLLSLVTLSTCYWRRLDLGTKSSSYGVYTHGHEHEETIVCVHGLGSDHDDACRGFWDDPRKLVAVDFRYELTAFAATLIERHASFIVDVLQHSCSSPAACHLVTYSMGGPTMVEALRQMSAQGLPPVNILTLNMMSPPLLSHPVPIDLPFEFFYARLRAFLPSLTTYPVFVRHGGWKDAIVPFELSPAIDNSYSVPGWQRSTEALLYSSKVHPRAMFNAATLTDVKRMINAHPQSQSSASSEPARVNASPEKISIEGDLSDHGKTLENLNNYETRVGCEGEGPLSLDTSNCGDDVEIQLVGRGHILSSADFDISVIIEGKQQLVRGGYKVYTDESAIWLADVHVKSVIDGVILPDGVRALIVKKSGTANRIITPFSVKDRGIMSSVVSVSCAGSDYILTDVGAFGKAISIGPYVEKVWCISNALNTANASQLIMQSLSEETALFIVVRIWHKEVGLLVSMILLGSYGLGGSWISRIISAASVGAAGLIWAAMIGEFEKFGVTLSSALLVSLLVTVIFALFRLFCKSRKNEESIAPRKLNYIHCAIIVIASFVGTMYPPPSILLCSIVLAFKRKTPERVSWLLMLLLTFLNLKPFIAVLTTSSPIVLPFLAVGFWWSLLIAYPPVFYTGMILFGFKDGLQRNHKQAESYQKRMRIVSIALGTVSLLMLAAGIVPAHQTWIINIWFVLATIFRCFGLPIKGATELTEAV